MTTTNSADAARLLQSAAAADPTLATRLAEAGIDPATVSGPDDLAAVPVQSKDARVAGRDHVLGGGVPRRIFQSPGPIYEAQPDGDDPWRWREALASAGLVPGDIVLNCFGYHLSPAGAMFDEAVVAAGATVLPGGIGNQQLQVQAIRDLGIRGYVGLPSYLKALIDLFAAEGGTPADMPLQYAVVTAEPLPDSLRAELEAWVPAVRMAYGSAEAGLISYEDGRGAGMVTAADIVVDVCDIADGTPVTTDAPGEVVVSILRESAPLVRFGTGDLSAWVIDGGEPVLTDGRRRLVGVLGRTGQATKVRGMFLHPTQVKAVAAKLAGTEALRFLVGREDHKDTIVAEVVVAAGADAEVAQAEAADLIRSELRFRAEVRAVAAIEGDEVIVDERSWD
ncbi:phenylacetate--CoA ligase family protein [Brevibacterium yomogidense]|uniref:Coenzyme F390 synthetase n=1 Tax=Brevibacterium yomogidense TaxID=946573 RepID=A0A1X6XIN6_9MICO|nr:AMP-binding protein [Brevibacterium yomogidense]SLM98879.1 Coenzyme F390 synthetase [Brevibacterium yomogidense]